MLGRRIRSGFADSLVRSPELSRFGILGRRHRHSSVLTGIPSRFFSRSVGGGVGATIVIGTYYHFCSTLRPGTGSRRDGGGSGWRRFCIAPAWPGGPTRDLSMRSCASNSSIQQNECGR
jgi:hypothetical protein